MKKIFALVLVCLISSFLIAEEKSDKLKIVGFNIGLCSGFPMYSASDVSDMNEAVNDGDFNRFIIGTLADVDFRCCGQLKIAFGIDNLCDFIWNGSKYSNHIDYAFWGGLRCYPNLYGFNFSVAYALGQRADFINNSVEDSVVFHSAWGNGFRLALEYDFHHNSKYKCLPSLGVYYRFMPRGKNEFDNLLVLYAVISF